MEKNTLTEKKGLEQKYAHIKGWGIDADSANEPTYPMKNYTGDDHQRLNWERPPLQKFEVEKLKSIEHPRYTAVIGTSVPPSGLSGIIRRFAFKYGEGSWGHWLPLLLADRVNVIEGYIDDLSHGYVPNVFKERGWKAEWEHNPKGLITRALVIIGITAGIVTLIRRKK